MEDLILIVDDARFARRIETKALQDAGFEHIVEAKTAKEALQIFEEQAPELTLLDITLPDNSGSDTAADNDKNPPGSKDCHEFGNRPGTDYSGCTECGSKRFYYKAF